MNVGWAISEFNQKNGIRSPISIEDIANFFRKLKDALESRDINAQIIANYLHYNIASEQRRKRKVTARDFEDFIALVFGGKVMDNESRKNEISVELKNVEDYISKYVASNRREKMDINFGKFGISVKTFVPDNKEINMGSFAREALFYKFLSQKEYGGERKAGLGSKPQMLSLFKKIKDSGKWDEFSQRYESMVNNIFVDDILNVVKGGNYLDIYVLSGKDFRKLMINKLIKGPDSAVSIINRYEGNSIRINRDPVFSTSELIRFDFTKIDDSKLQEISASFEVMEKAVFENLNNRKSVSDLNKALISSIEKIMKLVKQ